jgi:hypothetical protein
MHACYQGRRLGVRPDLVHHACPRRSLDTVRVRIATHGSDGCAANSPRGVAPSAPYRSRSGAEQPPALFSLRARACGGAAALMRPGWATRSWRFLAVDADAGHRDLLEQVRRGHLRVGIVREALLEAGVKASLKAATDSQTAWLRNTQLPAMPRYSWVEMNPGLVLRYAASVAQLGAAGRRPRAPR